VEVIQERGRRKPRFIVCGDNALAYRLVQELATAVGDEVTVILPSIAGNHGPRLVALAKAQVIEAGELSEAVFRAAGAEQASAVALVSQDDVGNVHAALRVQEVNPHCRLVIRLYSTSLGDRIRTLFPACDVLSDASAAAPSFVAGALGELTPSYVRLPGRTVYVALRSEVAADRVVCALADTTVPGRPELLPADQNAGDLVLAVADGKAAVAGFTAHRRGPELWRTLRWRIAASFNRKLAIATLGLFTLLGLGTMFLASMGGYSWTNGLYLTLLDAAGAAQPDTGLNTVAKIVQTLVTLVGISIIPLVTATVVDAIVRAQLATALGRPRPIAGHVVVVGLGNVGTRVVEQLHDLGVPVVCVESDEHARGVQLARRLDVPIVFGDASREDILRAAYVHTSRALVTVTDDDITNLEAGLHGQTMSRDPRIVLRLFDDDLAEKVQRSFGITISRSVSHLAAPAFAAAMLGRQLLGTIPVGRRVLLIAEVPVHAGSDLEGLTSRMVDSPRQVQVIAIHRNTTGGIELPPPSGYTVASGDRLIVLTTRAGLGRLLARSAGTSVPPS